MYLNKNFAPSCNCGARILPGLKNPLLLKAAALVAIIVGRGLVFASHVTAQTFSNLYSFSAGTNNPTGGVGFTAAVSNYDGAYPACTLILVSNKLYGTCATGGSNQNGTLFAIGLDGTGFTNLYTFSAVNPSGDRNGDGARPSGSLVASNDTLYGTTSSGGVAGRGVVFSVKLDGSSF